MVCPLCIAIPLALAGAGGAVAGSSKKQYETRRKMLFWSIIAMVVSFIIFAIWFFFLRNCTSCKLK